MRPNSIFYNALNAILDEVEARKNVFEVVDVSGYTKDSIEIDVNGNQLEVKSGDKVLYRAYVNHLHSKTINAKYVDEMEALLIKLTPKESKVKIEIV